MRRNATQKDDKKGNLKDGNHRSERFLPVVDSRKRKVRGMVERNGRYYAQMRVALPDGKSKAIRIPLESTRLDHAIAEAEAKRTEKRQGDVHLPGVRPNFSKLVEQYTPFTSVRAAIGAWGFLLKAKAPKSMRNNHLKDGSIILEAKELIG